MLNIHELYAAQDPGFCLLLGCKLYEMKYYPTHVSHYCMSQFLFRLCLRPADPDIARCTDANSLMCCINLRTLAYISESSNLFKCLHFPPNKTKHTHRNVNSNNVCIICQCSHSCDHGLQKRTVSCHRVNLYNWVDPETTDVTRCSHNKRPQEVRACVLPGCEAQVIWVPGEWSKVGNLLSGNLYQDF